MTAELARYVDSIGEQLTRSEHAVLHRMALVCTAAQRCWLSNATLAETTGYSVRQVRRVKRGLEERGLIVRLSRARTDIYLVLGDVRIEPCPPNARSADAMSGGEDTMSPDLEFKDLDLPTDRDREPGTSPARVRGTSRAKSKSFEELSAALDAEAASLFEEATRGAPNGAAGGRRRSQASHAGVEGDARSVRPALDSRDGRRTDSGVGERSRRRRG